MDRLCCGQKMVEYVNDFFALNIDIDRYYICLKCGGYEREIKGTLDQEEAEDLVHQLDLKMEWEDGKEN
jgi:hypothetical protein